MDIPVTTIWWRDERLLTAEAVLVIPTATLPGGNCWLPADKLRWQYLLPALHTPWGLSSQLTHWDLGTDFQALFLWPSSEGRHWAKSLKQNNSALLLHLSALTYLSTESYRGNKLLILTANSSTPASSGTPMSVWSITGLGSLSKLHTSTLLTSTKTGNIMATLINLHSAQPTERAELPSQYRQVLDNRGFRKAACLYTSLSSFTVIYI